MDFNGAEIYADPLAPSAVAGQFLSLGAAGRQAGNNHLWSMVQELNSDRHDCDHLSTPC